MSVVSRRAVPTASFRSRRVKAGAVASLMSAILALGGGTPATWAANTSQDVTPPTLSEVTISPSQVNPARSNQWVTVRGRITDDSSGIVDDTDAGSARITFQSDGSPAAQTGVVFTARQRVWGTPTDGIYQQTMLVPHGATGLFAPTRLELIDDEGNFRATTGAELDVSFRAVDTVLIPSEPTAVRVTAGSGSLNVSWGAPLNDGGAARTGYRITASGPVCGVIFGCQEMSGETPATGQTGSGDVSVTAGPSATSATITGLTDGRQYSVRVMASNSAGWGATSRPVSATPETSTTTTTSTGATTTTTTVPDPTTTSTTTTTTAPPVQVVPASVRSGYWMVSAEGRVYSFGDALHHGEPRAQLGNAAAVDLEPTSSGSGYWVLDDTGRVHTYGDAGWFGNVSATPLVAGERATSLSRTVSGAGYWVFTNRGRVVPFGNAVSYGDVAAVPLNGPVLDSIVTPTGQGYYMVASDGGIFSFGDATFHGSMSGTTLNAAVQSLVPDGDGEGYWLVASDGGIFAFKAPFRGSLGGQRLNRPVSGMVRLGNGYLMVGEDGGIFNFSDRPFLGSLGATPPAHPVVAVAVLES